MIKLLEHEGKTILAGAGIAVPEGALYRDLPMHLDGPLVVKAQILSGGRGKAGGIRFVDGQAAARLSAASLVGSNIGGHTVEDVYVERRLDIAREFYLAALVDRDLGVPILLACAEGGVDIEDMPPDRIMRQIVDPLLGLQPFMIRRILHGLKLDGDAATACTHVVERLYAALVGEDAELIEINPLVLTAAGDFVAADAKVVLDEDAAFRHSGRRAVPGGSAFELESRTLGVIGVEIGANRGVAAIMNGAGLTMATLDEVIALGGDVCGVVELHGATAHGPDRIADVIGLVLRQLDPAIIMVNVHFQFRSLETIAHGVARALERLPALSRDRLVLRLRGEKEAQARAILSPFDCPILSDFGEACAQAASRAGRRTA